MTVLKCKEVQPNVIGTTRREKWLTEFAYPASINVRLIAIVTLKVESVVTITVVTKSISKHWLTCHASTILGAKICFLATIAVSISWVPPNSRLRVPIGTSDAVPTQKDLWWSLQMI